MRAVAEFEMAGDEVCVKMGQEHVRDPALQPPGILEVLPHVALWIDDRRVACLWVGDQV